MLKDSLTAEDAEDAEVKQGNKKAENGRNSLRPREPLGSPSQ
jgi:predicted transcriptional regulator